jgi:DNA-binding NarL/FixJ family response regulator
MRPARRRASRPPAVGPVIRLLIVDDNAMIRFGLRQIFTALDGFEVVGEAQNGEEAIRQARALLPDVILMDVSMPTLDGVEATRQILATHPTISVLMLSALDGQSHVDRARAAGAVGYLHKSIEPAALVDAVRSAYHPRIPPDPAARPQPCDPQTP